MAKSTSFEQRLKVALQRARIPHFSPTKVSTEFNLRHYGGPVSVQAVRKWLDGTSMPAPEKILTLGRWLRVSPAWLLFGEEIGAESKAAEPRPDPYPDIWEHYAKLSPEGQAVVRDLILVLLRRQKGK
jgi:hypothetical protein